MKKKSGGALKVKEIKRFIEHSGPGGEVDNRDVYDYELDKELSNNFAHVYYNPKTKKAVITHRGSATVNDAITDARLMLNGSREPDRFAIAKITQEKAEEKYGPQNLTTLGSSLGGLIAEDVGKNSHNIITFSKAVPPSERKKHIPKNQFDIRTKRDFISYLSKYQKHENQPIVIPSETFNPVTEHLYPVLDRLPPEMLIGNGRFKSLNVKDLKEIIKEQRKLKKVKVNITGLNKKELNKIAMHLLQQ